MEIEELKSKIIQKVLEINGENILKEILRILLNNKKV